jgi:hypothetical protein
VTSRRGTTTVASTVPDTLEEARHYEQATHLSNGERIRDYPGQSLPPEPDPLAVYDGEDPVITGRLQIQGDIPIQPWPEDIAPEARQQEIDGSKPVPPEGIVLATGAEGHDHTLIDPDQSGVRFTPWTGSNTIGTIIVPPDGVAYIDHSEHGRNKVGPGVYVARQQVEGFSADELDNVWD